MGAYPSKAVSRVRQPGNRVLYGGPAGGGNLTSCKLSPFIGRSERDIPRKIQPLVCAGHGTI